ncbi:hypothetical protein AA23498_0594 [Acetobacter nitrogenifigens DSM 23921 = NBRC 105050]|uniref:Lipoprotein n=1 Tax=Acetobacter nitrogenifigens DSM 23921 = NBRC 105050 TaxID=1120919 RepID=A0A511X840_9PROT|nr:hypothetical protein [Acetobacter nitrogenifigens]GBQ89335.1 hypothetical protein AA23498_0594 [Acetobacter nitrogenifigens DSM 23921 = NBRC 105050]GEN59117.1 hypothetical protein ANI02nite_10010 [Acetobacter nitrogenifigens DSM 23921 = NBRC 105050]
MKRRPSFRVSSKSVLIACLLTAGCGVTGPFQVVASNQYVASTGRIIDVTSVDGREVPLQTMVVLQPDCSSAGASVITVDSRPGNGTVDIRPGSYYSAYPASDRQRYACNMSKHAGVAAVYRPNPGYHGTDLTTLSTTGPEGRSFSRTYRIAVQ